MEKQQCRDKWVEEKLLLSELEGTLEIIKSVIWRAYKE